MQPHQQQAITDLLAKLRRNYLARLPTELSALQVLGAELGGGEDARPTLEAIHRQLHKLAGSSGTFGLPSLGVQARILEQRAKAWLASELNDMPESVWRSFEADLNALNHASGAVETPAERLPQPAELSRSADKTLRVWVVDDDAMLGEGLQHQLESFNYVVRLFNRLEQADQAARSGAPDLLIMDVMFESEDRNATEVFADYPALSALRCPLLFITSTDDFQSRIRAARLGAVGYFLKPIDTPRLVNRMGQLFDQMHAPAQRVLIVDDDATLATHMSLVLQAAGIDASVLQHPEAILSELAAFQPDLVLMDVDMPGYTGPELAGVIRQHDKWTGLPIVYLSAETDLERQISAMSRGGDDFLTKPISDTHLVRAVRVRVERARQLADQINKDSLTGLLKHGSIKEAALNAVRRARRIDKPVTLAMIDIDHFKSVNDSHGHAAGDLVISALANLLRQRLRQSDPLGRYGGEEFLVVLPECTSADAQILLDDIRQRFSQLLFSYEGRGFSCTLSAGHATSIHALPDQEEDKLLAAYHDTNLLAAADTALYEAKRSGRDRVYAALRPQD